jgi:UDP-N-acetylglucosamine 2-epimerase (non-hydrolysing)
MKLIIVAGARPNFMKVAPLMNILKEEPSIETILVHTGQHYDIKMSGQFFEELNIPTPHLNLGVGSASQAVQMARIIESFEQVCLNEIPDAVLVVGDVTSTAACTLVASKLGIKTIHYEAGLRSRDRSMPEEINRLVTDAISDIFFTTSVDATENLQKEGVEDSKIYMVGNLMIDTLILNKDKTSFAELSFHLLNSEKVINSITDFEQSNYGIVTFHRPSNVDDKQSLAKLIDMCGKVSQNIPLIFPIHPRTYKNIQKFDLLKEISQYKKIYLIEPLGYLYFMCLVEHSRFVLTDSGGIQEETTYLNIPCLTVRPNTERPVTIWTGSNKLIKIDDILSEVLLILEGKGKKGEIPEFWDGKSAERIINIIKSLEL